MATRITDELLLRGHQAVNMTPNFPTLAHFTNSVWPRGKCLWGGNSTSGLEEDPTGFARKCSACSLLDPYNDHYVWDMPNCIALHLRESPFDAEGERIVHERGAEEITENPAVWFGVPLNAQDADD